MAGKATRKISPEERLFGLTCNLLLAPGGLSASEILQLPGYEHENTETAIKAVNKLFERDKETLRESGINLIVENITSAMDDNQTFRYRIPNESFEWPENLTFTARQLALLELAARAWAGASLGAATSYGIQRLRALGQEPSSLDLFGVAPRIGGIRHFDKIAGAIDANAQIQFEYRKPNGEVSKRSIEPWQLEQVASQWLVVGKDVDAADIRRFLLKRIVSRVVTVTDEHFEPPTNQMLAEAAADLQEYISGQEFVLEIQPGTPAWFHFRMDEPGVANGNEYRANFMDLHLLAEELRLFGSGVQVLSPPELRTELERGLRRTLEVHGG